jgi:hypothetical protein
LLVFCIGKYDEYTQGEGNSIKEKGEATSSISISDGTADIIRFLSFLGPYFNPTNNGPWTFPLGLMLNFFCSHFSRRIGAEVGQVALTASHPTVAQDYCLCEPYLNDNIPHNEIPLIIDALLPLCHQVTYSKSGYVGKAGEAGLLSLIQISPTYTAPYFLDFATAALDVTSVNLSHQAPSALGVLDRLLQPSLRRNPSMILQRLPQILSLTLLGIDSNDRRKTIATLTFYQTVTSWLPIGSVVSNNCSQQRLSESSGAHDGTVRLQDDLMDYQKQVEKSTEFRHALAPPINSWKLRRSLGFFFDDGKGLISTLAVPGLRGVDLVLAVPGLGLANLRRGLIVATTTTVNPILTSATVLVLMVTTFFFIFIDGITTMMHIQVNQSGGGY